MKNPNGYGTVYRIKDRKTKDGKVVRRRNPWVARVTRGYKTDYKTKKSLPIYQYVGYYSTRKEAMDALEDFKRSKEYNVEHMPFEVCFDQWSGKHFQDIREGTQTVYRQAFRQCVSIHKRAMSGLTIPELQQIIDEQKTYGAKKTVKMLFSQLFEHAYQQGACTLDLQSRIEYLDIDHGVQPAKRPHSVFTRDEIDAAWADGQVYTLILLYTGLRIGELLELKKENVHLEERYLQIVRAKTAAGIRIVPIAKKILPFIEQLMKGNSEYLVKQWRTRYGFVTGYWSANQPDHSPHDTRHTFVTMCEEAGIDDRIVKAMVGHARADITATYSHIGLQAMLDSVDDL